MKGYKMTRPDGDRRTIQGKEGWPPIPKECPFRKPQYDRRKDR